MPILAKELDLYPQDLLQREETGAEQQRCWWAVYTLSRREKELMRRLLPLEIAFYCPITAQRHRSRSGRIRTAYVPVFSNYVFVYGDVEDRYRMLTTNCVAQVVQVGDGLQLTRDLRQLHELTEQGAPLTRESRLAPGQRVRVRTGAFRGFEGYILRREGQTRLLIAVSFLQQGASVLLDDCDVDPI